MLGGPGPARLAPQDLAWQWCLGLRAGPQHAPTPTPTWGVQALGVTGSATDAWLFNEMTARETCHPKR